MKKIYEGKTKVLLKSNNDFFLEFQDNVLGSKSGEVDPGGNEVVGKLEGKAEASARTAAHFFSILNEEKIPNHFIELSSPTRIKISSSNRLPLEVIYREKAYGSYLRRYSGFVEPMEELQIIEFNLKADELGDPLLTEDSIVKLDLAGQEEIRKIKNMVREVVQLIQENLEKYELDLIDLKLEFGNQNGEIEVIDEISGDTMRVFDSDNEVILNQVELAERLGLLK
ncbi:MAG: phosphoribosylaminoimidazolesuccinocarboxamide synthase [Hadesarchaea archaeon]|nr:phosphoribosylaminoimidazolesuccinocarboxamide synthase [Hadesarchaea archaeon]